MSSFSREALERDGFDGFLTFNELRARITTVSASGGVYFVLRESATAITFLDANPGGRFQRDPTVAADVLHGKWVEAAQVVYIGKGDNIQRRLKQYADFGAGKPIGH